MKKLISLMLIFVLNYGFVLAKEIKIGVIMPMSGAISGYGLSSFDGLELMHKLQPKLKNGDTVKLILVDNKSDKIEAANAATKLISSDKVSAIIGPLSSTNTMAMTKIAETAKVPVVSPVATNALVTKRKEFVSRVCFSDAFQGVVLGNFAFNTLKQKEAVLITDVKNDYSIGISKVFKKQYKKLGGKIIKNVKINAGDKDFKAALSSIKALKAKFIVLPVYSPEAALIAKQAKQLGIGAQFLGSESTASDKVFFEVGGKAVEGFYLVSLYSPQAPKNTPLSKEYSKAYEKKFKTDVHPFSVLAADAYNVVIAAMNKCEDPTNTICVNKNIRATKNFQGASGIITLDKGDAVRSAVINQVKNGKQVYLTTVNP